MIDTGASRRTRLRVVVIQVLAFSLVATLLGRLYFLQVVEGGSYQARAASQSVRDIVQQPDRGLIVDAEGRPLVANRTAWVVSVDRTTLGRLSPRGQELVLRRVSEAVDVSESRLRARLVDCGGEGARARLCWNGSPYQPVPVAEDVAEEVALRILEQQEDYPGVLAEQQSLRAYPAPYGINLAHVLGYLSPVTSEELAAATEDGDTTLNGASVVGRAGVEQTYDRWLRGVPGHRSVAVDSRGRVQSDAGVVEAEPGDTLVTSIDAKVQARVERQLARTIRNARRTFDPVTGRNYVADSGAVVVMEARTGRIVAMASQPTYDPAAWVGGIGSRQLKRLYDERSGHPLLGRATQGQFAPGSTWKPIMAVAALDHGYPQTTRLNCSSGLQVGNRWFKNYESASHGYLGFDQALQLSCDTFFYRVALRYWQAAGGDPTDLTARDPLVDGAKAFGFGEATGVDLPGEADGRVADRRWKKAYYRAMKDYYCGIDADPGDASAFVRLFAHEFCLEGYYYRAGDAVNFSIGQGDTLVTPLQLARAYAALSNGGTLFAPRVAKAIVDAQGNLVREIEPKAAAQVPATPATMRYVDRALLGTTTVGTMAWRMAGFPLDRVPIRSKTGSAEVQGKQSTSWVASYDENYVVVMMVSQAGTGSGTSGPAVRAIWEALYGVRGETVDPGRAAIPGVVPPAELPTFTRDGSVLPPRRSR